MPKTKKILDTDKRSDQFFVQPRLAFDKSLGLKIHYVFLHLAHLAYNLSRSVADL